MAPESRDASVTISRDLQVDLDVICLCVMLSFTISFAPIQVVNILHMIISPNF